MYARTPQIKDSFLGVLKEAAVVRRQSMHYYKYKITYLPCRAA
jgi:hypothetical protein